MSIEDESQVDVPTSFGEVPVNSPDETEKQYYLDGFLPVMHSHREGEIERLDLDDVKRQGFETHVHKSTEDMRWRLWAKRSGDRP